LTNRPITSTINSSSKKQNKSKQKYNKITKNDLINQDSASLRFQTSHNFFYKNNFTDSRITPVLTQYDGFIDRNKV
jgi:hypothetical protein